MDIEIRSATKGDIGVIAANNAALALETESEVCGLRLYVERENNRAQQTYLQCRLVDAGYFVMEEDFSGVVTHTRS